MDILHVPFCVKKPACACEQMFAGYNMVSLPGICAFLRLVFMNKNAATFLSCFCALLAASHCVGAQVPVPSASLTLQSPDTLVPPFSGNYLAPLLALRAAHDTYAVSPQWRDLYFEALAFQDSLVGNDAQAIADFDAAQAAGAALGAGDGSGRRFSTGVQSGRCPANNFAPGGTAPSSLYQ